MIHSSFLHAYMLSHLQLGFYILFFSQKFGVIFFTSLPFHTLSLMLVFHLSHYYSTSPLSSILYRTLNCLLESLPLLLSLFPSRDGLQSTKHALAPWHSQRPLCKSMSQRILYGLLLKTGCLECQSVKHYITHVATTDSLVF